jgi:hypothetical protein
MQTSEHPPEFPNVKVRLRLTAKGPALPARENYLEIWIKGTRFHVRDESGRDVASILRDITAPRGLGDPPHSVEEIMDMWSQSLNTRIGATELFGDLSTDEGIVCRAGQDPWQLPAGRLAPAARQILLDELEPAQLEHRSDNTRFNRPATEYHGFVGGTDQGIGYKNEITRVVAPPYVLYSDVRDADNAGHYYTREIVSLEENVVADTELSPPMRKP